MNPDKRESWLPLARSIYDDTDRYKSGMARGLDFDKLSLTRQDRYIARAQAYVRLAPEEADPLVLLGFKSELNRAMHESEERWRQVTRVRELLCDLPKRERAYVAQALDGPERCHARSGDDSDVRCTHDAGHAPIADSPYAVPGRVWQHAAPGFWWSER